MPAEFYEFHSAFETISTDTRSKASVNLSQGKQLAMANLNYILRPSATRYEQCQHIFARTNGVTYGCVDSVADKKEMVKRCEEALSKRAQKSAKNRSAKGGGLGKAGDKNKAKIKGVALCYKGVIALPADANPLHLMHMAQEILEHLAADSEAMVVAAIHYDRPGNPHLHLWIVDGPETMESARARAEERKAQRSEDDTKKTRVNRRDQVRLNERYGYKNGRHEIGQIIDRISVCEGLRRPQLLTLAERGLDKLPQVHEGPEPKHKFERYGPDADLSYQAQEKLLTNFWRILRNNYDVSAWDPAKPIVADIEIFPDRLRSFAGWAIEQINEYVDKGHHQTVYAAMPTLALTQQLLGPFWQGSRAQKKKSLAEHAATPITEISGDGADQQATEQQPPLQKMQLTMEPAEISSAKNIQPKIEESLPAEPEHPKAVLGEKDTTSSLEEFKSVELEFDQICSSFWCEFLEKEWDALDAQPMELGSGRSRSSVQRVHQAAKAAIDQDGSTLSRTEGLNSSRQHQETHREMAYADKLLSSVPTLVIERLMGEIDYQEFEKELDLDGTEIAAAPSIISPQAPLLPSAPNKAVTKDAFSYEPIKTTQLDPDWEEWDEEWSAVEIVGINSRNHTPSKTLAAEPAPQIRTPLNKESLPPATIGAIDNVSKESSTAQPPAQTARKSPRKSLQEGIQMCLDRQSLRSSSDPIKNAQADHARTCEVYRRRGLFKAVFDKDTARYDAVLSPEEDKDRLTWHFYDLCHKQLHDLIQKLPELKRHMVVYSRSSSKVRDVTGAPPSWSEIKEIVIQRLRNSSRHRSDDER
ncbi:MobA/MobL family protein [Cohaesibacter sp. ES.047]|uniref:MobA/MobL family protein n=1 Tax=Cohaesibacter sp. ES.047 TaxID=1798205 RepID=UPI000BB6F8FA|nr:MobA/MobL family protein [Cohaesibacter sp. ES.047]SNY93274.1 MobA/MobL family protein [Cohaesibacter sp. ES.047]